MSYEIWAIKNILSFKVLSTVLEIERVEGKNQGSQLLMLMLIRFVGLVAGCAKDQGVCAKCCCHVNQIVGRFISFFLGVLPLLLFWAINFSLLTFLMIFHCILLFVLCRDAAEVEAEQKMLEEVYLSCLFLVY